MPLLSVVADEAASTTFKVADVMQSAINSVQGDLLGVLAIAVPAIAVVTGAVVGVKFGIKWLKSLGRG